MNTELIEKIACEGDGEYTLKSPEEFQHMACKEDAVSPINVNYSNTRKVILPELSWENWKKKPLKMELFNTGHTLLLAGLWRKNKPMLSGGPLPTQYKFLQLHFHWGNKDGEGSFHTFDNEALPLELHAIFLKECYETQEEALKHKDGLIVLVYVYKVHDNGDQSIEVISKLCPLVRDAGNSVFCPPMEIGSLLYPFSHDYFVYKGSIRVNEKGHAMLWLLCRHPLAVSREQLQRFRNLMSKDAKSSGDRCRANILNSKENDLFLVNPSSSLQTTLFDVDSNMKWEYIRAKFTASKDKRRNKSVEKNKVLSNEVQEDISDQFNLNLVVKAVRAVKSLMEKSGEDELMVNNSKSLNDISEPVNSCGKSRRDQKLSRTSLASEASTADRVKSTVQYTSPANIAERTLTIANASEHQADSRQEAGSEANCSRSRIQFEDEVSDEIWMEQLEPGASSEPESEIHLVSPKPRLLSTQDSVQYLRQNYTRKSQNTAANNNTCSSNQKGTQKSIQQPGKHKNEIKQTPQATPKKQTVKIHQRSQIPVQITPNKSKLKNQNAQSITKNEPHDRTRVVQRSSTAPGLSAGKSGKPVSPPSNHRPATARESGRQSAMKRPVTAKEPLNPVPIRRTNTDINPRWKY
ncbi:uncharacterized protein LOC111052156 [Nilaparvata lugens]|uniref:uncharacterized protein LOC111052156 n=1 Tax=Nilaparvata lugens TaxID=108931 RepID=UPI00193E09F4|nr:uncharacterized protein LOC111052156 [Nilaparvata lugens]